MDLRELNYLAMRFCDEARRQSSSEDASVAEQAMILDICDQVSAVQRRLEAMWRAIVAERNKRSGA